MLVRKCSLATVRLVIFHVCIKYTILNKTSFWFSASKFHIISIRACICARAHMNVVHALHFSLAELVQASTACVCMWAILFADIYAQRYARTASIRKLYSTHFRYISATAKHRAYNAASRNMPSGARVWCGCWFVCVCFDTASSSMRWCNNYEICVEFT